MPKRIFISYARADREKIDTLDRLLRASKLDVWFDIRLDPGSQWKEEIELEINKSDIFLFVISESSVRSEWCKWELEVAQKLGKPIIPVRIDLTQIPNNLQNLHVADFSRGFTPEEIAKLVSTINHLGFQPQTEPTYAQIPTDIRVEIKSNWFSGSTKADAQFNLRTRHVVTCRLVGANIGWWLYLHVDGIELKRTPVFAITQFRFPFTIEDAKCQLAYNALFFGTRLELLVNGFRVGWDT